ncbi:VWA domain-containing protein, partial [Candidatus Sumerlaeota bacterium]|nr:VWA domain-containing protein [Candidatus Sumerlaeota bacterium]
MTNPWVLWALLLLPCIVWIDRLSWRSAGKWRRRGVLLFRTLEISCLILALAGLRWERAIERVCVLFAIDSSRSVPESARVEALETIKKSTREMAPDDLAGILVFGREPLVEAVPQSAVNVDSIQSRPDPDFTDIAALLRLATGVFPEGMHRRLVIFSDGNENRGDTLEALRSVRAASVQVDVFPIRSEPRYEVSLTRLDLPGRIEKDEPFSLKVEAFSSQPAPAILRFYRDGVAAGHMEVALQEGRNQLSYTFTESEPGFHLYEARIESPADLRTENNVAAGFIRVSGPSRLLLVGSQEDNVALRDVLDRSSLAYETSISLPGSVARLQAYDAVILNNRPAADFSPQQLEDLERYVRILGGGLGMIGGEDSFGPGGWIGTPAERALPVRMELKNKERFPSLAMVMVIDKSGSMGGTRGGASTKMDMANRAAVEAVKLLGPKDLAGVVAFDSKAKWVAELVEASKRGQLRRNVLSIMPGGGTDAYQGALAAYEALVQAEAKLKHIILLTDGHTRPADFVNLILDLNEAGITFSTVAIGSDADQTFLESLARNGGGRYYYCPDPARIPRIFVRETILVQRSYLIEETATPTRAASHPILADGALSSAPALHGWVVTELKSRSEPVLKIKDDPLLATWQYGLGKTMAFTSDAKSRWARDWTAWGGFQPFWERAIRWTLRSTASEDLHPRLELDRGVGRLSVDALSTSGERLNFLNLKARIIRPDDVVEELDLRQTALGTYEVEFEAEGPGAYMAAIFDAEGRQTSTGGMVAYSPEFKDFGSNDYLLNEIWSQTGGKLNPTPEEIFRREGHQVRSATEITFGLLVAALALLLVEVAVRRLYLDEEQVAKLRAWLRRAKGLRWATAGGTLEQGLASSLT